MDGWMDGQTTDGQTDRRMEPSSKGKRSRRSRRSRRNTRDHIVHRAFPGRRPASSQQPATAKHLKPRHHIGLRVPCIVHHASCCPTQYICITTWPDGLMANFYSCRTLSTALRYATLSYAPVRRRRIRNSQHTTRPRLPPLPTLLHVGPRRA